MISNKFRVLRWIAALACALDCLAVAVLFSLNQSIPSAPFSNLWPVPGLYFLELFAIAILSIVFILDRPTPTFLSSPQIPWISAGILLAFAILGAWSIGPFLLPALLSLLLLGVLDELSNGISANWGMVLLLMIGLLLLSLAILGAWAIQTPLIVTIALLLLGLLLILIIEFSVVKTRVFKHLAYLLFGGFMQTLVIILFSSF